MSVNDNVRCSHGWTGPWNSRPCGCAVHGPRWEYTNPSGQTFSAFNGEDVNILQLAATVRDRVDRDRLAEAYGVGAETYQEARNEGDSTSEAILAADNAVATFLGVDVDEARRLIHGIEDGDIVLVGEEGL